MVINHGIRFVVISSHATTPLIAVNVLNRMTEFGMPESEAIAA
jgi:hypothetical protein